MPFIETKKIVGFLVSWCFGFAVSKIQTSRTTNPNFQFANFENSKTPPSHNSKISNFGTLTSAKTVTLETSRKTRLPTSKIYRCKKSKSNLQFFKNIIFEKNNLEFFDFAGKLVYPNPRIRDPTGPKNQKS